MYSYNIGSSFSVYSDWIHVVYFNKMRPRAESNISLFFFFFVVKELEKEEKTNLLLI